LDYGPPTLGGALKTLASMRPLRGRDKDAQDHYRQALAIEERAIASAKSGGCAYLMSIVRFDKPAGKKQ